MYDVRTKLLFTHTSNGYTLELTQNDDPALLPYEATLLHGERVLDFYGFSQNLNRELEVLHNMRARIMSGEDLAGHERDDLF